MFGLPFPFGFGRRHGRNIITLTLLGSKKRTDIKDISIDAVSDHGDHRIVTVNGMLIDVIESHTEILKLLGWDKVIKDDIQHEKDEKKREKERIEREKMYEKEEKERKKGRIKRDKEMAAREKRNKKNNKIRSG